MFEKMRKACLVILISVLSISTWEVGKKQYGYIKSRITYKREQENIDKTENVQKYLSENDFDWIKVSGTSINYPLVSHENNEYYLTHDYKGEDSISGAIYYDASDEKYNGRLTVIFGHSMKDGSMFNNLHYFSNKERFKTSRLYINTTEGEKTYKPLGYDIYNGSNPYYRKIDDMNSEEAVAYLKENSDYFIDYVDIDENAHIIALVTCDYSIDNGRVVVFYISE